MELDFRGIRIPGSMLNNIPNPTLGQQKKYLSAEHLQAKVDEYFESLYGYVVNKNGDLVRDDDGKLVKRLEIPPTVSGLALYLDVDTMTLSKWRRGALDGIDTDDELTFARVLQRAKQRIESYAEARSYDKDGQRGAEFILKTHYGWKTDKELVETQKIIEDMKLKREEFDLKKSLVDSGKVDGDFTINIVRKSEEL